jgi:hypothetical protein
MKKYLFLKLFVLSILSYVAIMPSNEVSADCDKSECVTFDPIPGQKYGDPVCAYYDTGYTNYRSECFVEGSEVPPGSNNWVNMCKITEC